MKQFVFGVVLIVVACGTSAAQAEHSEQVVETHSFKSLQEKSRTPQSTAGLPDTFAGDATPSSNRLAKPIKRDPTPFMVFSDSARTLEELKTHEKERSEPSLSTDQGFRWSAAIKQSLLFLGVQHGYAMTQPKTRRDLKGPFFKDYLNSVKSLHGWEDGGRFFTNYVAHPMQGSLLGFIQIQNDPKGTNLRYNESSAYWRSRLKAMAWAAVWSTQFEIGPVSQASIGNVGLHGKQTYVDIVMTPTAGIGLLVLEDFLDQKLIRTIERNSHSYYVKIASRTFLNPTRSVANLLRFKVPWHRDDGLRSTSIKVTL